MNPRNEKLINLTVLVITKLVRSNEFIVFDTEKDHSLVPLDDILDGIMLNVYRTMVPYYAY